MFENLLHQNSTELIKADIKKHSFPGSVLFSGPETSGKFTAALETARILGCQNTPKALWNCTCPSCLQNKAMVNQNVLICGPRDCIQEIQASGKAFTDELSKNSPHITAARYLFIRSIRKLTNRFNPVLWKDDDKLNKIAAITSQIDEELETIDFPHELPETAKIGKTVETLTELSKKLEENFLYDSIPVNQIRNISYWARLKNSSEGSKTVIIENADRMLESVRNALLKILEEPPSDTIFILTTSRRNAVMPTILSRVRTYTFTERTAEQQTEVISRVFHNDEFKGSINEYLLTFLPLKPEEIRKLARDFFISIAQNHIPDIPGTIKNCKNFEPRIMLKIFLSEILNAQRPCLKYAQGAEASNQSVKVIQECWNNITVYNQTVQSGFEILVRSLSKINKLHGNVFRCVTM